MDFSVFGKARDVRAVHNEKEPVLISSNASGSFTAVNPVQPAKAYSPIDVTELGMAMEVSPEQLLKAAEPILVSEADNVMDESWLQAPKAWSPMEVTVLGKTMDVILSLYRNALSHIAVTMYSLPSITATCGTMISPVFSVAATEHVPLSLI